MGAQHTHAANTRPHAYMKYSLRAASLSAHPAHTHTQTHTICEHPARCPNIHAACAHPPMLTHSLHVARSGMRVVCMHIPCIVLCILLHSAVTCSAWSQLAWPGKQLGNTPYSFLTLEEGTRCVGHVGHKADPGPCHRFLLWRGCAGTSLLRGSNFHPKCIHG